MSAGAAGARTMRVSRSPRHALGDRQRGSDEILTEHQRAVRAHDRELLLGDARERRAQPARVLEADAGQHRDARVDHAGRVVAASEPCLHHRHVHLAASHLPQRGGGQQFELGDVVALAQRAVDALGRPRRSRDRRGEALGVDFEPIDEDPLAVGDEMRGEICARAQAVAFEDRGGHPRGRGLAVGAEHVDGVEATLGRAEHGHHAPHPIQAEAHPEQLQRAQLALGLRLGPAWVGQGPSRRRLTPSRGGGGACA